MSFSFAVLCFAVVACLSTTDASEQVHLSIGQDHCQMIVTWVSQGQPPDHSVVRFAPLNVIRKTTAFGNWTSFKPGGDRVIFIHRVVLNDLNQNSIYEYAVSEKGDVWSEEFNFKTSLNQSSVNIAILGDMGFENARSMPQLLEQVKDHKLDAVFHVGDLAYDLKDHKGRTGDDFMNMIQPISSAIPYQILPGNHENFNNFSHYDNLFSMIDSRTGDWNNFYYSFNVGPVHVVSITDDFYFFTNYGTGQIVSQYNWLIADLAEANRPENRMIRPWILVLSHRPMYCSASIEYFLTEMETVRNGIDGKFGLEQVLHDYKVDAFIVGHVHLYERTYPVFKDIVQKSYHDAEYPVHIITGAAGCNHGLMPILSIKPEYSAFRAMEYSYTIMNASGKKLRFQQISAQVSYTDARLHVNTHYPSSFSIGWPRD